MEDQLIEFFEMIEGEVEDLQFGTITINLVIVNGMPDINTLVVIKSKKRKYQPNDKESPLRTDQH